MNIDNFLFDVVRHYPFRVLSWSPIREDRQRLITDSGRKLLRLVPDETRVMAWSDLLDALALQRFRLTPRLLQTKDGERFVRMRQHAYFVTDDIAWRSVLLTDDDVLKAAHELGRLHQALREVPDEIAQRFSERPSSLDKMTDDLSTLQSAYQNIQGQKTPFSTLFAAVFDQVSARATRSLARARDAGLGQEGQQGLFLGGFDHEKIAATQHGAIAVVSFDDVGLGDPADDLDHYARYLFEQGSAGLLTTLFASYSRFAGLSPGQKERSLSYAGFPFATSAISRTYLKAKDRDNPAYATRLKEALRIDSGRGRQ